MKPYYKNTGGVTISGGEPMNDGKFLVDLIDALHKENIHVTVDTSGIGDNKYYEEIAQKADLFLLDIKHYDPEKFERITKAKQDLLVKFMYQISKTNTRVWIRHVMMPQVTDTREDMERLVEFIKPLKKNIDKIEILPYHTLGVEKYKKLNRDYPLKDMPQMNKQKAKELENYANFMLKSS